MNIGLVILAAGESSRMGMPKQLLPIFGTSMLKHLINEVFDTRCHPVTVVVGANKDKIVPDLQNVPISIIDNPNWAEGIGTSLKMGLIGTYMVAKTIDAVLYITSDMPSVTSTTIKKMISKAEIDTDKNFVVSKQQFEFPVLIKRPRFEELLDLKGENSIAGILAKFPKEIEYFDFEAGKFDLNTKKDYFEFTQSIN